LHRLDQEIQFLQEDQSFQLLHYFLVFLLNLEDQYCPMDRPVQEHLDYHYSPAFQKNQYLLQLLALLDFQEYQDCQLHQYFLMDQEILPDLVHHLDQLVQVCLLIQCFQLNQAIQLLHWALVVLENQVFQHFQQVLLVLYLRCCLGYPTDHLTLENLLDQQDLLILLSLVYLRYLVGHLGQLLQANLLDQKDLEIQYHLPGH